MMQKCSVQGLRPFKGAEVASIGAFCSLERRVARVDSASIFFACLPPSLAGQCADSSGDFLSFLSLHCSGGWVA